MSNDTNKADFLLFDSLGYHVDLIEMSVHSVTANVTFFLFLLQQFLLGFTSGCGEQVVRDFPGKYFSEGPQLGHQIDTIRPFLQDAS